MSLNWFSDVGGVPCPIQNQGDSSYCLIYASMSALACALVILNGPLLDFSVQHVLNVSPFDYPAPNGMYFDFINFKGVTTKTSYPSSDLVRGAIQRQQFDPSQVRSPVLAAEWTRVEGVEGILGALQFTAVVGFMSALPEFWEMMDEVFSTPNTGERNHAIIIYGYDTCRVSKRRYWSVQNSWGDKWGEEGRFRVERGVNLCGIEVEAYMPTPIAPNQLSFRLGIPLPDPEVGPSDMLLGNVGPAREWELMGDVEGMWQRGPSGLTNEDYIKFFHSLVANDFGDEKPMAWSHFNVEGDVEFKAVVFVPPKAPRDLHESGYSANKSNLNLYVRSVFISNEADELLPKYLSFLMGLVDSDTLPLDVSLQVLQHHYSWIPMKNELISKALDMICKLAEEDPDECDAKEKKEVGKASEKKGQYARFWNEFGSSVKLGIIEDVANRNCLTKLLRVETSKSGGKLISLGKYISRMLKGQNEIFFVRGSTKEQLETSSFFKSATKENFEVIFLTDPVDERLMQHLVEYEDKKFLSDPWGEENWG